MYDDLKAWEPLWTALQRQYTEAIERRFNLPTWDDQDWEYVQSDADKLDDFLAAIDDLQGELRDALIQLIVSSYDAFIDPDVADDPYEAKVRELLTTNWPYYRPIVVYWACLGQESADVGLDELFAITPFMRAILRDMD